MPEVRVVASGAPFRQGSKIGNSPLEPSFPILLFLECSRTGNERTGSVPDGCFFWLFYCDPPKIFIVKAKMHALSNSSSSFPDFSRQPFSERRSQRGLDNENSCAGVCVASQKTTKFTWQRAR